MQATNRDRYVRSCADARRSAGDATTGAGEAGVPAIANAVAQITDKQLRHLPMSA
jgi:CO/xanthine dehydrogenase Mo-binding subunit